MFPVPRVNPAVPHSTLKVPLPPLQSSKAAPAVDVLAERFVGCGQDSHATIPKTLTGSILEINPFNP